MVIVETEKTRKAGFTIVELLIVIVVIAILAAISIVSYNGIQGRAEDTRRITDAKNIVKALELYKINNGNYPAASYSGKGSVSGWETTSNETPGQFIAPIATAEYGFPTGVPIDPINNATGTARDAEFIKGYTYSYATYTAGTNNCDPERGAFYVLVVLRTKTYGLSKHPDSPGLKCGTRDWQGEGSWVTSGFVNG